MSKPSPRPSRYRRPTNRARKSPGSLQDAKRGAAQLVQEKYAISLRNLISFDDEPLEISFGDTSAIYYLPNMPSPEVKCPHSLEKGILRAFYEAIDEERTNAMVFIADPKEEAQNISDVAAAEKLRNIVLSLQALIPQYGVNASNYTEYMRRSQERLQAILRRPLVVAYADGGEKFGWIFGPRFEIGPDQKRGWIFEIGPDQKPKFSHTTVQRSVQASLVVPGWTRTLNINYKTYWVDRDGISRLVNEGTIPVKLPGDDAAITAKLLAASGERRIPFIEPPIGLNGQRQVIRLQAKQPGDILIRGRHLWRNPESFHRRAVG